MNQQQIQKKLKQTNAKYGNGHAYLESLLEHTLLDEFKTNIDNVWKEKTQHKHLFEIWLKSKNKTNEVISNLVTPKKSSNAVIITPIFHLMITVSMYFNSQFFSAKNSHWV